MSFDVEPDGDPHGECAQEIHRLQAQVQELQKILYRARWHVSTDNFCDCHARNGELHKSDDCLLLVLAAAVQRSPKCCPPFEPDKKIHSEFCCNFFKDRTPAAVAEDLRGRGYTEDQIKVMGKP